MKSDKLLSILKQNKIVFEAIQIISQIESPKLYIGAGAITQSVWNWIFGFNPDYAIEDIDIIYYNNDDLSEMSESTIIHLVSDQLKHIPIPLDIKNQARVHLWYKSKYGTEIPPLTSINDAVEHWPATANAIALRLDKNNNPEVIAPFGLDDLFAGIIRPNRELINASSFNKKAEKWVKKWPDLKIIPW